MVLLELFSGIGGFAKGFQTAGHEFKRHYFSEIDKHCIANYKYNFPHAEYIGSVTDVRGANIERPDIITFGSPCQDFSLAGKQLGLSGQRSVLILEAIRIIRELRPSVFIWENVKGAFSSNGGADFWAIIAAFANIGGYRLEWQLLNTSWVLPQNRERIYLIGHLDGRSIPSVFPFRESDTIHNESRKITKEIYTDNRIALTQQARQYASWNGDFIKVKQLTPKKQGERFVPQHDRVFDITGDMTCLHQDDRNYIAIPNPKILTKPHGFNKGTETDICPTLKSSSFEHNNHLKEGKNIRRLTEIECERLQGFPDDWTKWGIYQKQVWINKKEKTFKIVEGVQEVSKTRRYKMCGNAVTVKIVQLIAERLKLS